MDTEKTYRVLNLLKEILQVLLLLIVLVSLIFFVAVCTIINVCRRPTYLGTVGVVFVILCVIVFMCKYNNKEGGTESGSEAAMANVEAFIDKVIKDKPIRYTALQLRFATDHYGKLLGTGGFGSVYKGSLLDGVPIAVKLLCNERCDTQRHEQFIAEVSTIGTTNHLNLVRLYGFCFEKELLALVYEYMENGSLDRLLFNVKKKMDWKTLHEIAIGTAKGIAYLHEECEHRIIHYDIKPANILLDAKFIPKVADFGLAKLCSRDSTHITFSGFKGTPGYAAPELWMPSQITEKCDVYSFGMVLFEILGKRRNLSIGLPESQEWFPTWVWKKYEQGKMGQVFEQCGVSEDDSMVAERMAMVGMWCVQFRPQLRPLMSVVANMLEGVVEIPKPSYPFRHNAAEFLGADMGPLQFPNSSVRVVQGM